MDRGPKVDIKMYEANLRLLDENKLLRYDIEILNRKMDAIKKLCKIIDKEMVEMKPYTSRIIFILECSINEMEEI